MITNHWQLSYYHTSSTSSTIAHVLANLLLLRFTNIKLFDENLVMSHSVQQSDETIFSSGVSHVTVPDELNELVQYCMMRKSGFLYFILF